MMRLPRIADQAARSFPRLIHTSRHVHAPPSFNQAGPSSNRVSAEVQTPASPRRLGTTLQKENDQLNKSITASRPTGSTYAPSFLNLERHATSRKFRRRYPLLGPSATVAKQSDPLYQMGLHPGHPSLHDDSYKNPNLLSTYVSEMGKIQPRKNTKLTRRSQREVGKAIRRARSMGLIPVMSRDIYAWRTNR